MTLNGIAIVPAHAGVYRSRWSSRRRTAHRPRARGGVPLSPHCSRAQRTSSPRTRGCTAAAGAKDEGPDIVPAHAGVYRSHGVSASRWNHRPRARGGVPSIRLDEFYRTLSSPRTRGCTGERSQEDEAGAIVPAHAGVYRVAGCDSRLPPHRPRARGGVPILPPGSTISLRSSPRTRGCTDRDDVRRRIPPIVPAHAGVYRRTGRAH